MSSTCISNCINDTRVPVRSTYVNLHKWPESDAEFVRSLSFDQRKLGGTGTGVRAHPRVVDSISCRQMYLRSYTFHRNDQTETEKTKCFGRVKNNGNNNSKSGKKSPTRKRKLKKNKTVVLRKARDVSCAALLAMFRRLLSCTTKVDVADHGD